VNVVVHLGVVWAYHVTGGWFRRLKAFPDAVDRKGEPDTGHPSVLKYVKDNS
jgi:hypothetical protein